MNLLTLNNAKCTNSFIDSNKNEWKYIEKNEMVTLYPNGGYKIIGDLKKVENKNGESVLIDDGKKAKLYPFSHTTKKFEKVLGFIPVEGEDDTFVRVIDKSYTSAILLIGIIIVVLLLAFLIGIKLTEDKVPGLDNTAVSYKVEGVKNEDPDSIALPGISILEVEANQTTAYYPLQNPDGNQCYMRYTITETDTDEVLYRSGLIEPAKAVTEYELSKSFEPGEYDITISVETFDINNYEISLNGGEMPAVLKVVEGE